MASSSAETDPKLVLKDPFAKVFKKVYVIYGEYVIPVCSSDGPNIEKDVGDERINIDDDRAFGFAIDMDIRKEIEMAEHGLYIRNTCARALAKIYKEAGDVFSKSQFGVMDKAGKGIEVGEHGGFLVLGLGGCGSKTSDELIKSAFEVMKKAGKGIGVDEYGGEKLGDILLGSTAQVGSSLIVHHLTSSTPSAGSYILAGANGVAFVAILMSKLLGGYKNKRAALLLRKMGSIAASSAIIMAMTMFVPASHRLWVSSLAVKQPTHPKA